MNFEELENWKGLSKEEQDRLKSLFDSDEQLEHAVSEETLISTKELKKGEATLKQVVKEEKKGHFIYAANTPLNIPGIKFVDYRDPIWGDSYNWSWNRSLDQVLKLVIHHTVTKHEATPDDIALLHKARGWGGIGYHFVITKDGTVYYVGDIGTARANVANNNEKIIGIVLVGDFTKHLPSSEQIVNAHGLCKFFMTSYPPLTKVWGWDDMIGHKETYGMWNGATATACPGTFKETPDSLYYRIKDRVPYEPIDPPTPDPCVIRDNTKIPQIDNKEVQQIKSELSDKTNKINELEGVKKNLEGEIRAQNEVIKGMKQDVQKYNEAREAWNVLLENLQ